jgi:hypothetical protein
MAPLKGKTVVFTGFRDEELRDKIAARGGRVASSVSRQTDILVASGSKGVLSAKAAKAREQGTRVMSRDDFAAEFFPPSLLDRVLGRGAQNSGGANAGRERCYQTHDNGGRPFKVCYNSRRFWVLKPSSEEEEEEVHDTIAVKPISYIRVFVGRSPLNDMTEFSGGHGPKFDGNSMLFELAPTRPGGSKSKREAVFNYMFVGDRVCEFGTRSPITAFVSPVGNNDVPYPFAVDRAGVVYLLTEEVQLTAGPYAEEVLRDPYDFYYRRSLLTPDRSVVGKDNAVVDQGVVPFEGITRFYIGSKPYTFSYTPDPEQAFERFSRFGRDKPNTPIYIYIAHGKKVQKEEFVGLMRRVGVQRGFAPLRSKVWVPRS